ncbi:LysR family transcriptional regulator [Slackia exigua]|uniref:LysR family transcriptional regulator n=1 Tax=Slackia exigua TaxID=84109 RepID=UPI0021093354|nr:LysR family transcriptional regulator [Slackia exigua]MCQ5092329.1 LysR family transcriptional regulator [Slackia exigua]
MAKQEPRLLGAAEVADRLGVCRTKAYGIIRELNDEMESRGCKVIAGRVSNEIFEETFFSPKGGTRHDR